MKKFTATLIGIFFLLGLIPVQVIPVQAAGSQSKSFAGSPATGSFKGSAVGDQSSFSTSFSVSAVPAGAQVQSASLSVYQSSYALGSGSTFELVDKNTDVTLGTKSISQSSTTHSFSGLNELVQDWVNTPSTNQGLLFKANGLDANDDISFAGISLTVTYFVEDETPPVISNIKVSSITNNSVKITWKTDEPALGFIDYGLTKSYGLAVAGSDYITDHFSTMSGLQSGSTYHFRVRDKDSSGNESVSGDFTFTTTGEQEISAIQDDDSPKDILLPPEDLTFEVKQTDSNFRVELKWDPSDTKEIDGYRIYRAVDERFPIELYKEVGKDILTLSDEEVDKDKTYFYLVRAYQGEVESSDSNEIIVKVDEVTTVSSVPIKDLAQSFWAKLAAVNVASLFLIGLVYYGIKKFGKPKKKVSPLRTSVKLT